MENCENCGIPLEDNNSQCQNCGYEPEDLSDSIYDDDYGSNIGSYDGWQDEW
jgi:predicted amidophosphoribosyltransferase